MHHEGNKWIQRRRQYSPLTDTLICLQLIIDDDDDEDDSDDDDDEDDVADDDDSFAFELSYERWWRFLFWWIWVLV